MSNTSQHPEPEGSSSVNFTTVVALIIGLSGGYFLGNYTGHNGSPFGSVSGSKEGAAPVAAAAPDSAVERFKVPVGSAAVNGPATAKVTIIEFSDYQCPFCGRVEPTIDQIKREYGKEVRIAFKHNPLPFHPNAKPAAVAALSAREQGEDKFWQLHEKLFKNQTALDEAHYIQYAGEVGLNVERFKQDMVQNKAKYEGQIQSDQAEASKYGANGTPAFFINGRFLSGAQPFEAFKKIIDEELVTADKALKAGASRDRLYATLIQNGKEGTAGGAGAGAKPAPAAANDNTVYRVPVGNAPVKGPEAAKVTIVEYSDFQCPFCSKVEPTIDKVVETYGKDVRVAFKENPLPFHNNAQIAAEAAMAANEQGKFWEMHKKLFANQTALERPSLEKYADELGLNVAKFKAALDSGKFKQAIKDDTAEAAKFGARGTPSFFINGKPFRGAQPFENFKTAIDKELEAANAKLKSGVSLAALYGEITKGGADKAEAPAAAPARPAEASDTSTYKALLGDAPVQGPKDARVTIVTFSDFQCPFCGRVEPTLKQVRDTYPRDVRIAFKQLPLPFHNNAQLAAEASLAAKEQGKFWDMHDKLFANQTALERPSLEKYAGEIGLNMDKFKAALDSGKFKEQVKAELAEGNKIGARGTPSFFVNGKSLVGAQPFEQFKTKIDEALKEATALMKQKRIPATKVYDELMKDAKTEVAAAPAAAGGGEEAEDKTVYKVEAGTGPSWGDRSAPVTIVEFSDFQCPFCSRVLPAVKQIKEKYAGKVRIVWRNYPLPFHDKAALAAQAALAANDQGKFWDMHDKMFGNQGALDRSALEKYAAEIGLDVAKFKADLDSGKWKSAVDSDVQYGNGLPGGGLGTPTFFINGRKLAGAYPFEDFDKLIQAALNKKG